MFENILTFMRKFCIISKKMRKAECGCHLHRMEVVRMIEIEMLLIVIKLLLTGLISVTIIAFALIIALTLIMSK